MNGKVDKCLSGKVSCFLHMVSEFRKNVLILKEIKYLSSFAHFMCCFCVHKTD